MVLKLRIIDRVVTHSWQYHGHAVGIPCREQPNELIRLSATAVAKTAKAWITKIAKIAS